MFYFKIIINLSQKFYHLKNFFNILRLKYISSIYFFILTQVTLITCTWNSKKTIKNCRVSILDQTYDDIEHIIIDNTSDDEKLKIFFLNQYIVKKNSGEASNKNIDNIIIRMLVDYKILTKNKINPLKSIIYKNLSKITQFF